ncbi:Imm26 family immunity protein [Capnocytophaga gingivalis]|uniref:Imm26 family immunity protein n=1 Tax=Capnocytophaga gingivalis TaxID=1017 RepID=UPI0028D15FD1|nr:Imm26 family immunity protein [Capnocytophaga gingivalis]
MKNHSLEGKVIGLPLKEHLFLTGLVTRQNKDILLGYFFRQTYRNLPTITEWKPSEVCLICLFSALGIKNKEWEIIGNFPKWNRQEWEVPTFKLRDPINESVYYAIAYDDNIISSKRYRITKEEAEKYYRDGIYGYKAVEVVLSNKIDLIIH